MEDIGFMVKEDKIKIELKKHQAEQVLSMILSATFRGNDAKAIVSLIETFEKAINS